MVWPLFCVYSCGIEVRLWQCSIRKSATPIARWGRKACGAGNVRCWTSAISHSQPAGLPKMSEAIRLFCAWFALSYAEGAAIHGTYWRNEAWYHTASDETNDSRTTYFFEIPHTPEWSRGHNMTTHDCNRVAEPHTGSWGPFAVLAFCSKGLTIISPYGRVAEPHPGLTWFSVNCTPISRKAWKYNMLQRIACSWHEACYR